jgi:hypothetical protein
MKTIFVPNILHFELSFYPNDPRQDKFDAMGFLDRQMRSKKMITENILNIICGKKGVQIQNITLKES